MIEQINNPIRFLAFFVAGKVGKPGLAVAVNVYNPAGALIVSGVNALEMGDGLYAYVLAGASVPTEGEYVAVFKTADLSVDQRDIPAAWIVGRAGVEHLDVSISSRNAVAPPTVAAIRAEMDTSSTKLANLDAAISSRSTYAGADTPGTSTLLGRLTDNRAGRLDHLDVAISSRNAVAPDNVGIAGIKAKTDLLPAAPAAAGSPMTLAGSERVKLAAVQPDYAPAKAGDGMVAIALPNPAPAGYGGSFEGDISGLTAEQAQQLLDLHTRLSEVRAALLDKLNVGEPEQPVIAIPAPPPDASVCRVFGYLETLDNKPAANITVAFELLAPDPIKADRLISGRCLFARTDGSGQLVADGQPYVELQRNDRLSTPGTKYRVSCPSLNLRKEITLTTETYDLANVTN